MQTFEDEYWQSAVASVTLTTPHDPTFRPVDSILNLQPSSAVDPKVGGLAAPTHCATGGRILVPGALTFAFIVSA